MLARTPSFPSRPARRAAVLAAVALAGLAVPDANLDAQRRRERDSVRALLRSDSVRDQLREISRASRRLDRARRDSILANRTLDGATLASAFADTDARTMLRRARVARLAQDSALHSYRAKTTMRVSIGLGVRRVGLEKLLFRGDNVARVGWSRDGGVWVTPIGSRTYVPLAGADADVEADDFVDAVTIPYFPGKESLWLPSSEFGMVRTDVDERQLVHPIARGAEAYYRYASGDSLDIQLPDGRTVRLRELRITARRPEWRLFVGSFWFDRDGGQLVRAAYRLAVPIELWDVVDEEIAADADEGVYRRRLRDSIARATLDPGVYAADSTRRARYSDDDGAPGWVKGIFQPARGTLDAVTVEYALFEGRFWLPRANSATANLRMGPMRVPFSIHEKFEYDVVNGDFSTPPIPDPDDRDVKGDLPVAHAGDDGTTEVTVTIGGGGDGPTPRRAGACAEGDSIWIRTESRYNGNLRVAYRMPCDLGTLASSPELPPVGAAADAIFDVGAAERLLESLDLGLQPAWGPQRPRVRTGLDLIRYNRVEGLSPAVEVTSALGAGYTARAEARLGLEDLQFNGELGLVRSTGRREVFGRVYRRLDATAPEWGDPLSFGPSLGALLYTRDEGFYYRSVGAEVGARTEWRGGATRWRLFHEQQRTAGDTSVVNTWSLGRLLADRRFRTNFDASRVSVTGLAVDWERRYGNDPAGTHLVSAVRAEGGTGTLTYARAAVEATVSRPVGGLALALTGSVGTSAGEVPVQRGWFLGGLRTVRGQAPGTQYGDAFWFARLEAGTELRAVRPVLFFDAGWAGDRDRFGAGDLQRGVGLGLGLLDGLIRLDLARGLFPNAGWRTDLYLGAPL